MTAGRFIVLEGPDGVGKSTQAALLAERLGALVTREPGATPVGKAIRELLLAHSTVDLEPRAEALLMAADRAQHVATVVRPALEQGRDVVSDRYLYSSVAYQGHGRGLPAAEIAQLSTWATGGLLPDVVVLLEAPGGLLTQRRARGGDRLEAAGEGFFARVEEGYRAQLAADPDRWCVVDASGPLERTAALVAEAVSARLALVARG
jgi:dTMP kinase